MQIVNGPKDGVKSATDEYEVFYLDYGNQEKVPYSRLRPADAEISGRPGLAVLCSLAHIKVPELEDDCGQEAAEFLSYCILENAKEFQAVIEERDNTAGKAKGRGTGNLLIVTLMDPSSETSINAAMLQVCLLPLSLLLSFFFFILKYIFSFWHLNSCLIEMFCDGYIYRKG